MVRPAFFLLIIQIILLGAFIGCKKIYEPIEVQGRVIDIATSQPIADAEVRIVLPEDLAAITFSNENGEYLFEEVNVDSIIDIRLQASKQGFDIDSITLLAAPEKPLNVPPLRLKNLGQADDSSNPVSRGSALVSFVSKSKDFIQVQGTGGDEIVDFEFVVRDSSGTPISNNNAVYVKFEITAGPNAGEYIYPDSTLTLNGVARASLTSGTRAGVVQIRASINRNGITSHSSPIPITISGGFPNDNHFEVSSTKSNIPANSSSPKEIHVLLGDRHGNPVIPGTAVFFSTNKGNIDGSANTDEEGYASSLLRTNNTTPGIATVRVETVDESSSKIFRELDMLFSGRPNISISPQDIDLLGFESQVFEVVLSDEIGNPLSEGTTMDVIIDHPDLILNGSVSIELGDYIEPGIGKTHFEFRLRNPDKVPLEDEINLIISTMGPNGQTSKTLILEPEKTVIGEPGSIYVESISATSIGVRATGQREDTQITFQVVDVNGNPLNNESEVDVDLKFGNRPNGGEFLSKSKARTNNLGQVTVTLTSGERSGTVQVVAETIDSNNRIIRSQPVGVTINAGLPDEQYFSLLPSQRNMTYAKFGHEYEITAIAGDKYSNTVPDGVAIFFESDGGSIDGSAITTVGNARTILKMGHPVPSNGLARIRAYTTNDNQNTISTTTNVIFSGSPSISVNPSTFNLQNGEDQTFTIRVRDSNGYPMVKGSTINVTIEGDGLSIIGNTSFTLRDVNSDLSNIDELTRFIINVRDADPGNVTDDPVILTIEVEGPNGYARHTIEGRKAKIF